MLAGNFLPDYFKYKESKSFKTISGNIDSTDFIPWTFKEKSSLVRLSLQSGQCSLQGLDHEIKFKYFAKLDSSLSKCALHFTKFSFAMEPCQSHCFLDFFFFFMYDIQHCFICRLSDSIVSEDAGIEPRTVATTALADLIHNSARSHPHSDR